VAQDILDTKIEFLKGIGPRKAELLNNELTIHTFRDLVQHYPFRHEDRSQFYDIGEITEDYPYVQLKGYITQVQVSGKKHKKRLTALLRDSSGMVELIWFRSVDWIQKNLQKGRMYIVYGKPNMYGKRFSIPHPEYELFDPQKQREGTLYPVYHSTEKLRKFSLESKFISKHLQKLFELYFHKINETLPQEVVQKYRFISRREALKNIHFPTSIQALQKAKTRLKFEELFYLQIQLLQIRTDRKEKFKAQQLRKTTLLTEFYKNHLPFDLTNAQKRVIREIYQDVGSGDQMNRLLQGDVGSGKTIVAFIAMLMAIDGNSQACMMAPTEILADQHFTGLKEFADLLGLKIAKLTGSSKTSERRIIHEQLLSGELNIIVGTHALIEDTVDFQNLGLCVIDEQHRFGVAQRAKLWAKSSKGHPHMLVMTATPIPRTLAMTLYGDLDVSIIDELPAGRKPIKTIHKYDSSRLAVFGSMKKQIEEGRQVYVVYPLIEESETLDYKNLQDGYESICRAFPNVPISIVHGKMKPKDKDYEMQRFVRNKTKIMVATTVIEVGVNVPNATVMVIENSERFGLAQLHQLRGRVGRGADQSFCILMSSYKLSKEARFRIETMVRTNNGFEIADADLKLRGPGDLHGTQQSGIVNLKLADIAKDQLILRQARETASAILEKDSKLQSPDYQIIIEYLKKFRNLEAEWERIS